jgi:hypothetical protein
VKRGIRFEQQRLASIGRGIGFVGLLMVVGLPGILGVRNDNSEHGTLLDVLITSLGTLLIIIGTQLALEAYKSEDESPKWIKCIVKMWK